MSQTSHEDKEEGGAGSLMLGIFLVTLDIMC